MSIGDLLKNANSPYSGLIYHKATPSVFIDSVSTIRPCLKSFNTSRAFRLHLEFHCNGEKILEGKIARCLLYSQCRPKEFVLSNVDGGFVSGHAPCHMSGITHTEKLAENIQLLFLY
jgi:hypothetical protein